MGGSQLKDKSNIKTNITGLLKNLRTLEQWSYENKEDKTPDTGLKESDYKYSQTLKNGHFQGNTKGCQLKSQN